MSDITNGSWLLLGTSKARDRLPQVPNRRKMFAQLRFADNEN